LAIEHVLSQGLYRDQSLVLLVDCLELLPFSDDPAGGIARVEEVLDKFEHRPYQFRDVVTAMGYTRSEAAVPLLLKIARGKSGPHSIETPWLESLGRLNTDTSRRTLLSFIDPDIPFVGVNLAFDHHNVEIYAAFVGAGAREDSGLKQKLLALSAGKLTATQQRLLPTIYGELGDFDTMVAGANLLHGGLSPLLGKGGLESQFLERQPHGNSYSFSFYPTKRRKSARSPNNDWMMISSYSRNLALPPFGDSVLSVVEARRADIVRDDFAIGDHLRILPTPAHTPGHVAFAAGRGKDDAVFCCDIMHSPVCTENLNPDVVMMKSAEDGV
jgi:hypothetical protein